MASLARSKSIEEKSQVVSAFALALILPRDNPASPDFVPVLVNEHTADVTGWHGLESFVKVFCYNDSIPDSSDRIVSEATTALKKAGVLRGASNKGVYSFEGKNKLSGQYKPRDQGCGGVYFGRLPNPNDPADAAVVTEALKAVPEWALRAPNIYPANLAEKVFEALRLIEFTAEATVTESLSTPSGSSSGGPDGAPPASKKKKKPLRAMTQVELDENHPTNVAAPVNITAQAVAHASKSIDENPVLCDVLASTAEVFLRTDLGKRILTTKTHMLSPDSKKAKKFLLGMPVLRQLQVNNERVRKQAHALSQVPSSSSPGPSCSSSSSSPSSSSSSSSSEIS